MVWDALMPPVEVTTLNSPDDLQKPLKEGRLARKQPHTAITASKPQGAATNEDGDTSST
jgi:hypothetical protein